MSDDFAIHYWERMSWVRMEWEGTECNLDPDRNSFMIASRSFCGMSPCIDDTVKFASIIFSVNQSTWCTQTHWPINLQHQLIKSRVTTELWCLGTHLPLGVAEDDGLCDGEGVVKVTQSVELPLFTLDRHEKLFDSFQSQLITEIKCHSVISIDLANDLLQKMQ